MKPGSSAFYLSTRIPTTVNTTLIILVPPSSPRFFNSVKFSFILFQISKLTTSLSSGGDRMPQTLDNVENDTTPNSLRGKFEQQDTQANYSEILPTTYTADSEASVAPADRGKGAWFFLSACWAVQFLIYGMFFYQLSFNTSGLIEVKIRIWLLIWGVQGLLQHA